MMKSKRLYICILWILLAIVLLILIYINKDSTEWQPLITKIVRVYLVASFILTGILSRTKKKK